MGGGTFAIPQPGRLQSHAMWYAYFEPRYVVGWGTLALINSGLAQGKNRNGLLWFVISIFLGPLATLLVVLIPRA